jgi:Arc/MetJ-type ribon-helix-helix transcriptional regulator
MSSGTNQTTIPLSDDEAAFVQRLLDEGRYPSVEAIMDRALELVAEEIAAEASAEGGQGSQQPSNAGSPEGDL